MNYLKKVNDEFYAARDIDTGALFTLNKGKRGVYGFGEAWYLKVIYGGADRSLATFCTKDDGHKVFKEDYDGVLWTDADAILSADQMVGGFLSIIGGRV